MRIEKNLGFPKFYLIFLAYSIQRSTFQWLEIPIVNKLILFPLIKVLQVIVLSNTPNLEMAFVGDIPKSKGLNSSTKQGL